MIRINPDFDGGEDDELSAPLFSEGELVRHRRYGYRGVVVSLTLEFDGDEGWYQSNQTQPDKAQPWYHVLVHGGIQNTYAAQSSLEADPEGEPIEHPMIPLFFSGFEDGSYVRNDMPWEL